MKVFTKQIGKDGKWHSGCTFKGYDYSESGDSVKEAQGKIAATLTAMGLDFNELVWEKPAPYFYQNTKGNNYNYYRPKIDNL